MTELVALVLCHHPKVAEFCRNSPGIIIKKSLFTTQLSETEFDEIINQPPPPELIIVDAELEMDYRTSDLHRRLGHTLKIPMIVVGQTPLHHQESSDCIRLTLPPQRHLWTDLYQAALLVRKLHKVIKMMRHTVERPSEFSVSDLTQDKLEQSLFDEQYRSAQRRFQLMAATVQQTREGIMLIKPDHIIEYVNHAAERLLQSSKPEIIGKHVGRIKLSRLGQTLAQIISQLSHSGGNWQGDLEVEESVFDTNITTIHDKEDKNVGFAVIINDITAKEELERRFAEAEKLEALGNLAGGIAHDFNNILLALQANVEALRMVAPPPPEADKYFDRINTACDRAEQLTKHFLNFSRRIKESEQTVSLRHIIHETVTLLETTIPKHISLRLEIHDNVSEINANPILVYEIIMNLVKNAVDATKDPNGIITVILQDEELAEQNRYGLSAGKYVRLSIADTGTGITEDIASHIFEPFFTTKKIGHGTGLGLSVVHGIVSAMNGHIGVKSTPGHGSEFYIHLPVRPPTTELENLPPDGYHGRILLISKNDEPEREKLAKLLEEAQCHVSIAQDAQRALEMLRDNPDAFNLLLSDQVWRNSSGENLFEQAFRIKEHLPSILITDYTETTDFSYAALNKVVMLLRPYAPSVLQQAAITLLRGKVGSRRNSNIT